MRDLSVIVISYNTIDITKKCLDYLYNSLKKDKDVAAEVIVVDNGSIDGSQKMLEAFSAKLQISNNKSQINTKDQNIKFMKILNSKNLGFARANNMAAKRAEGRYLLFLNSDAYIKKVTFADLVYYLDKNPEVGALTVHITLPNGQIDPASHRGLPTVWRSFTYFTRLQRLFSRLPFLSKPFGGYHLTHLDLDTIHEIDSPSGAFYMTRRDLFHKLGGFDTDFFMYGEDLDLSYRIKQKGFKIMYYPLFSVEHLKYKSGLAHNAFKTKMQTRKHFYQAMKIFYDKHYAPRRPVLLNRLVHFFIDLKSKS